MALKKEKGYYAWNVYCLRSASADSIFQEILSRANSFKEEEQVPEKGKSGVNKRVNVEESVYYQLLLEAHILSRICLDSIFYILMLFNSNLSFI